MYWLTCLLRWLVTQAYEPADIKVAFPDKPT
jgi:hypothetical protein